MDAPPPKVVKATEVNPIRALRARCDNETEIVVAERVFPDTKYRWIYPKSAVIIVRMELDIDGVANSLSTQMSSKSSKLVLCVDSQEQYSDKEVKGKILK